MTGKQPVQGCYAVAWVGVEPTTFELQGKPTLSTEPRCPVGQSLPIRQLLRKQELPPITGLCALCKLSWNALVSFALSVMQCQRRLQISWVKNIGSIFDVSGIALRLVPP